MTFSVFCGVVDCLFGVQLVLFQCCCWGIKTRICPLQWLSISLTVSPVHESSVIIILVHTICPFRVRMQNKPFIDSSCPCIARHSSWLLITTETDKDRFTESHPLRSSILYHCYTVEYWNGWTYWCTMYTQSDNWLMWFTFQLEFDHFSVQAPFSCLTTATEQRHGHPLTSIALDIVNHSQIWSRTTSSRLCWGWFPFVNLHGYIVPCPLILLILWLTDTIVDCATIACPDQDVAVLFAVVVIVGGRGASDFLSVSRWRAKIYCIHHHSSL